LLHRFLSGRYDASGLRLLRRTLGEQLGLGLWGWRWQSLVVDELEDEGRGLFLVDGRRRRGLGPALLEERDRGHVLVGQGDADGGGRLRVLDERRGVLDGGLDADRDRGSGLRPEREHVRAFRARLGAWRGPQVALAADDSRIVLHRAKTERV
jgi:hypothetical protein